MYGWHFLQKSGRLQFSPNTKVKPGQKLTITPPVKLCQRGYHASDSPIDALQWAPGPVICRVRLTGQIIHDTDKAVATERRVFWMADATMVLHEFACWCAENGLKKDGVTDKRCWEAIKVKRQWMKGEATDEELATAWNAVRVPRLPLPWNFAAWVTARVAVTWDAAWEAQNKKLEDMLLTLRNPASLN